MMNEKKKLKEVKNDIQKQFQDKLFFKFNQLRESNINLKKNQIPIKELSNNLKYENFLGITFSQNLHEIEYEYFSQIFRRLQTEFTKVLQMNVNFHETLNQQIYSPFCEYLQLHPLLELFEFSISSHQNLTAESLEQLLGTIQKLTNLKALRLSFSKKEKNIQDNINIQYSLCPLKNLKFLEINFINLELSRECVKQIGIDLRNLKLLEVFSFTLKQNLELFEEDIQQLSTGISTLENLLNLKLNWQLKKIDQCCFIQLSESLNKLKLLQKLLIHISSSMDIHNSSSEIVCRSFCSLKKLNEFSLLLNENQQVNNLFFFGQEFLHLGQTLTELNLTFNKKLTNGNSYLVEIARGLPFLLNLKKLEIKSDYLCKFKQDELIQLYKGLQKCLWLEKISLNMKHQFIFCFIALIQTLQKIYQYSLRLFNNNFVHFQRNCENEINSITIDSENIWDDDAVQGLNFAFNQLPKLNKIQIITDSNNEKGICPISKSLIDRIKHVHLQLHNNLQDANNLVECISNLKEINQFTYDITQNSISNNHLKAMNQIGLIPNLQILNLIISFKMKMKQSSNKNLNIYSSNLFLSLKTLNITFKLKKLIYSNSFVQFYQWMTHCKNLKELSLKTYDERVNFHPFHIEISKILCNLDSLDSLNISITHQNHFFINKDCFELNQRLYLRLRKLNITYDLPINFEHFLLIEKPLSLLKNLEYFDFNTVGCYISKLFKDLFSNLLLKITNLRYLSCRNMQSNQDMFRKQLRLVLIRQNI